MTVEHICGRVAGAGLRLCEGSPGDCTSHTGASPKAAPAPATRCSDPRRTGSAISVAISPRMGRRVVATGGATTALGRSGTRGGIVSQEHRPGGQCREGFLFDEWSDPEGISAISRWLSGAIPPEMDERRNRIPEGCQQIPRWHPSGMQTLHFTSPVVRLRRPPANRFDRFAVKSSPCNTFQNPSRRCPAGRRKCAMDAGLTLPLRGKSFSRGSSPRVPQRAAKRHRAASPVATARRPLRGGMPGITAQISRRALAPGSPETAAQPGASARRLMNHWGEMD
jgi:hypothetical protein